MRIILTEDVQNLGEMGEIVDVADGYGRNYLIPQGLALPATSGSAKQLNHQRQQIELRKEQQIEEAKAILGDIDGISVTIPRLTADTDRLYGSVTSRDITEALSQQGHEVDRRKVYLEDNLSELGIYKVPIKLASGIFAHVRVWVVAK